MIPAGAGSTGSASGWTVIVAGGCELAERPVWDERSGTLVWVDCLAGQLHRCVPPADDRATSTSWPDTRATVGAMVGAAGLRFDGGLVAAADSAFVLLDQAGRPDADPIPVDMPAGHRFNDGACDPAGRFLAGTTSRTSTGGGGVLWSLERSGQVRTLLEGVTESNGLGWSADACTFYYVDSSEPVVRRYRYDPHSGELGVRLADLAVVAEGDGVPDGLAVDADGAVWVALWEGASIRRYSPDGDCVAAYQMPVDRPTCPVLGGSSRDLLVVTTAWEGMAPEQRAAQPWSGHVLARRVPHRAQPTYRFAGGPR